MRTYLILKEKAERWNSHPEIRSLLADIAEKNDTGKLVGKYHKERANSLLGQDFGRVALAEKGLEYERLDQLTTDILLGVD
jgi:xylose isomerase